MQKLLLLNFGKSLYISTDEKKKNDKWKTPQFNIASFHNRNKIRWNRQREFVSQRRGRNAAHLSSPVKSWLLTWRVSARTRKGGCEHWRRDVCHDGRKARRNLTRRLALKRRSVTLTGKKKTKQKHWKKIETKNKKCFFFSFSGWFHFFSFFF